MAVEGANDTLSVPPLPEARLHPEPQNVTRPVLRRRGQRRPDGTGDRRRLHRGSRSGPAGQSEREHQPQADPRHAARLRRSGPTSKRYESSNGARAKGQALHIASALLSRPSDTTLANGAPTRSRCRGDRRRGPPAPRQQAGCAECLLPPGRQARGGRGGDGGARARARRRARSRPHVAQAVRRGDGDRRARAGADADDRVPARRSRGSRWHGTRSPSSPGSIRLGAFAGKLAPAVEKHVVPRLQERGLLAAISAATCAPYGIRAPPLG